MENSKSILIVGNRNYGLAHALSKKFPTATFVSRTDSGSDLANYDTREQLAQDSINFDIIVLCSCLSQFRQTLLLERIYSSWISKNIHGQIVCIGSTADTPVKGTPWLYPIEKKALKAYCRNLSMAALGGHGSSPSGIRITYVSPGYLDTPRTETKHPNVRKISADYLAAIIEWVLQQPDNVNINSISLDPIQETL